METLSPFLELIYLGNTVQNYLLALGIFFGFYIFFFILKNRIFKALSRLAAKTSTDVDDEILCMVKSAPGILYFFAALFFGLQVIWVHPFLFKIVQIILVILVVYWGTKVASQIIEYLLFKFSKDKERAEKNTTYYAFALMAKILLWSTGILLILSNLGVNISALVASLGIGGIAVALALQNILGDIFSSFSIYLDKPFEVGDFIVVGEHMGTVKKIGLKTTRIQALQGEELVISNNELTKGRVQNFKKMTKRRILFHLGVTYNTPHEKLIEIPKILEKLITDMEKCTFDRANFQAFGNFSLNFEIVYHLESSDYNEYMRKQELINLGIVKAFEEQKVQIAFPTQTLHIHQEKSFV